MNARKAKTLRRAAEAATIGEDAALLMPVEHTRRTRPVKAADGSVMWTYSTVTMAHDKTTTRAVYKALKRAA